MKSSSPHLTAAGSTTNDLVLKYLDLVRVEDELEAG